MVGRRRAPFTDQQLIALHKKGMNDVEIARELGVNDSTVFYHRKKIGLESNYIPMVNYHQFIVLYEKGLNDREIAEELDVPKDAVKYRRRRIGLKAHGRKRLFTDQQLIDLHDEGLNDTEKAERLGASKGAVFYHGKRLGLKSIRAHRNVAQTRNL
jgi:FixJ family two-component response regulator